MEIQPQAKVMWLIVLTVLVIVLGCIAAGIYLDTTGQGMLGASLLTAIFSLIFGYLGGLGTANFFKRKDS